MRISGTIFDIFILESSLLEISLVRSFDKVKAPLPLFCYFCTEWDQSTSLSNKGSLLPKNA